MPKPLDRAEKLHQEIKRFFLKEWDPIGVGNISEAQDEYDSYIPKVYEMLISRRPQCDVFEYLWWLETEHIGLTGNRQRTEILAERLCNLVR